MPYSSQDWARLFERSFWVSFLGAVVAGAGVYFTDGTPLQAKLTPWMALLLGVSTICLAQEGIHQGRIRAKVRYVTRRNEPISYWVTVGFLYLCGTVLTVAGVWLSLFRS